MTSMTSTIPPAARMLRETMHLGGLIQDHALHFFFLAGPDFLTGDGSGSRDILGVIKGAPELALKAIGIRKTGQHIVATVGGRASHPVAAIPGGMSKSITIEQRDEMLGMVRGGMDDALMAAEVARESTMRLLDENPGYAVTPMPMMAITNPEGGLDFYDGDITVVETDGSLLERWPVTEFDAHIAEKVVPNSYAKSPYLISKGEAGSYRVGPLARLNIAASMPGERSQELMELFRTELGRPVHATLAYHWARMIELVAGYERLEALLSDDEIISSHVRVQVNRGPGSGTAVTEAPRGTLIHHYEADDVGRVTRAELIVATTHNTASLDAAVLEAVSGDYKDEALSDESVRRMELGIRAHDPCLSCATHEIGRMPLVVEVHALDGTLLARKGVE